MHHSRNSCDVTQTHCPHTAGPEGGDVEQHHQDLRTNTGSAQYYEQSTALNKYCQDTALMYSGAGLVARVKK